MAEVVHTFTITTTPNGLEIDWPHPADCPDANNCDFLRRVSRMGSTDLAHMAEGHPDGTYRLARFGFHSLCLTDNAGHILDRPKPLASQNGDPGGCRWCGINERTHARQYTENPGWHTYTRPTSDQIKARMRARRTAR